MMEKLRFFNTHSTDNVKKIGHFARLKNGYPFKSTEYTKSGEYNIITIGNVQGERYINQKTSKYPYLPKDIAKHQLLKNDDILISMTGNVGRVSYNKGERNLLNQRVGLLELSDKIEREFIFQLLQSVNFENAMIKCGQGAAQINIGKHDIESYEFYCPEKKEQLKIGGFLCSFDMLIQKQQEKIGLLKELKKGYLQQMFPVSGSKIPKIRFKGFSDAWEQCMLGDMAESFEYGLNASATEYDGINKYLRITDIDEDTRLFKTSDITSPNIDYNGSDNYLLKKGDILFARTGASVGKSYIYKESDGRVYFAGFLIRARIKSNYSPQFIYQTTLRDDYAKKIMITSQRSGQPGVNAKQYSNFEFLIPSYKEQIKIGDYFEKIDNLITLHQNTLKDIEELKKGYMQRLFAE